jgi:uncharacterized protein
MSQHLPDHFDPWRFADLAKRVNGSYRLEDLPRLRDCLADTRGEVCFSLEFSRDRQHRACLHGTVEAVLHLQCQRCLETMSFTVDSKVALAFVEGLDQAERLPDELDPQLVEGGRVSFKDLVEDELLLALPQVPAHPAGQCGSDLLGRSDESGANAEHKNPFAVLAELKRRTK